MIKGTRLYLKQKVAIRIAKFYPKPFSRWTAWIKMKNIFSNLNKNIKDTSIKLINYKLILEALPVNKKFKNKYGKICYLCKKNLEESCEHIFYECNTTKKIIQQLEDKKIFKQKINYEKLKYKLDTNKYEYFVLSLFVYSIWNLRNSFKNSNNNFNFLNAFMNIFNKWSISQTNI